MEKQINFYIVDHEDSLLHHLQETFSSHPELGIKLIGSASNFNRCINDMEHCKMADVFLINVHLSDRMGYELPSYIKEFNPKAKFIVAVEPDTRNFADQSKEMGAHDIIQKPFHAKILIRKIYTLMNYEKKSKVEDKENEFNPDNFEQIPKDSVQKKTNVNSLLNIKSIWQNNTEVSKPKMVCTFYSTSGQDKGSILANVAVAIAKQSDYNPKICILDLNVLYPCVFDKFNQQDMIGGEEKNIYNICDDISNISESLVKKALFTHDPTGICLLNTPEDRIYNAASLNKKNVLPQLIEFLKEMFDLILIDVSPNITSDLSLLPLIISDKTIVLIDPSVSNLLHTKNFIGSIKRLEESRSESIISRFDFVLMNDNKSSGIIAKDVQEVIYDYPVRISIPDDVKLKLYSNNGHFIVDKKNSQTGKTLIDLASTIYPLQEELNFSNDSSSISEKMINYLKTLIKK